MSILGSIASIAVETAAALFLRAGLRILSKVDQRSFGSPVTFTTIYVVVLPVLPGFLQLFFGYLPRFVNVQQPPRPTPIQLGYRVNPAFHRNIDDRWGLDVGRRYRWCDTGYLEAGGEIWKGTPQSSFDSVCHSDPTVGGASHFRINIRKDAQN